MTISTFKSAQLTPRVSFIRNWGKNRKSVSPSFDEASHQSSLLSVWINVLWYLMNRLWKSSLQIIDPLLRSSEAKVHFEQDCDMRRLFGVFKWSHGIWKCKVRKHKTALSTLNGRGISHAVWSIWSVTFMFCRCLSIGNMRREEENSSLHSGHGRPTATFRPDLLSDAMAFSLNASISFSSVQLTVSPFSLAPVSKAVTCPLDLGPTVFTDLNLVSPQLLQPPISNHYLRNRTFT